MGHFDIKNSTLSHFLAEIQTFEILKARTGEGENMVII